MAITKEINQNLENIRSLILRNTRIKKQVFQRTSLLRKRRTENLKRKAQETSLEAPNLVRNPVGRSFIAQSMARTGKSFLERIMGFVGYLTAGWIFNNLPTWIALGKEFIARIKKGREIFSNFIDSVKGTFSGMGKVLDAALTNLKELDFLDSKKRLEKEWTNMTDQLNNIGKSVDDGYKLITTPLFDEEGKGVYSGEQIPELGTQIKEEPPKQQTTPTPEPTPPPQPEPTAQPTSTESKQTISKPSPKSSSGFIQSLGINNSIWNTYRDTIASIETAGYSLSGSYRAIGGYNNAYDGRYQMGSAAKQDAARLLGISVPSRSDFRNNPQLQEDMFLAYTYANHTYLMNGSAKYRESNPINRLQYLGYAHNQGWANAANWLATGVADTVDGFGTSGTKFTDALRSNLKKYITQTTQVQPQTPRVPQGQSKFESDMMDFRSFRSKKFGAPSERFATFNPDYYQMRELGVFGSGNYNIHPMADDTNYEIHEHRGAGHWENRAMDIPVPYKSKEGDMVAEFWRRKGYKVLWNNGDGVHDGHVHVEVPKNRTAEFFSMTRQMTNLSQERRGSKVIVIEEEGAAVASSTKKESDNVNFDMSIALNSVTKQNALTRLAYS